LQGLVLSFRIPNVLTEKQSSLDSANKLQAASLSYFTPSRRRGGSAVMVLPHDLDLSLDAPKSRVA
ncbi:MAG TPA: hypothetical protein VNY32_10095, partial [Candidatus Acidoferrales bacterium]|nr:hypothetical protein [Candidatus Acidoferrales bacterium]